MSATEPMGSEAELSIDDLAAQSGIPSRTIREYQSIGLLAPPQRRGRTGIYGPAHRRRLDLIGRLQRRGYSLAGIRDLLDAWTDGADLNEVLEIEPDDLVHVDEPGARVTVAELARVLPALVPGHLDNLLRVGLVDPCGPDAYCIPSPSLLHLSADMLHAGYSPKQLLSLLATINDAATRIADATATLLAKPPNGVSVDAFDRLASRGRGLLANGTGRLTIYSLGKRLAPDAPGRQRTRP